MLIAIICHDKPGALDVRMKTRPAHLAYMEGSGVKLVYAGPLFADNAETPQGSLIIGEFDSLEAARAFNKADPYTQAGLFEKVDFRPTRKVLPAA